MAAVQAPVGRDSELAVFDAALDALDRGGRPGFLQVVGEPGIGKTRLLAELGARSDARGHLVLSGRAAEFELEVPFALFASAFDDYLTAMEPSRFSALDAETYPDLAVAFSAFAPLAGGRPPSLHAERFRTHRAVRALLEELARPRPLVVTLDDLHWADPASVELLLHLLARVPAAPVLIAVAHRPAEVGSRLDGALARSVREGTSHRLDLAPLNPAEADALIGLRAPAPVREALYEESGGNPFYLEQLLRATDASPAAPFSLTGGDTVPPPVAAALASELAALSPPARRLLEAAAVIGDPFDDELAAVVADLDGAKALAGLDDLLARDLVRPLPSPRRFRFRHPIVRHAVYELASTGWRIGAHARAAEALSAHGLPAVVLAPHVERSARLGDLAAVGLMVEGAAAAEPRSPSTSALWYQSALRLLPETAEHQPQRLELMVRMAIARGTAGEFDQSREALSQVLAAMPPGTPGRVALVAFCAAMERSLGRNHEARRRLIEALGEVDDHDSADALELKLELAVDATVACDFADGRRWSEEVLAGAQRRGWAELEAAAASVSVFTDQDLVGPFEARLDRAAAIVDGLTDEQLGGRLDAAMWLGLGEFVAERLEGTVRHSRRAGEIARATGRSQFLPYTTVVEIMGLLWTGRLAELDDVVEAAVDVFRLTDDVALAETLSSRGYLRMCRGQIDAAVADGRDAVAVHRRRHGSPLLGAAIGVFLAHFLVEAGAPEEAHDVVLTMAGGEDLPFVERKGRFGALEVLTLVELARGDVDAADALSQRAVALDGFGRLPMESGSARRARAAVLLAQGDFSAAAEWALTAADGCEERGALVEAGRGRMLAGRALAGGGERDRAIAELERAEADFERCGASGFRDQAAAVLRRLGRRRPARSTRDKGPSALTEREVEIARLVSEGRTNRDIAAACYLSEKTVERHVSHIFDKLGVKSRAAVAALVSREHERSQP